MNKAPAFQFYPADWLDKRVLRMSDAAQGVYMRILCFMWKDSSDQCSIEKDLSKLSKIVGISKPKMKKYLNEMQTENDPIFIENGSLYRSKRLAEEHAKQQDRSDKATASIRSRWDREPIRANYERNTDEVRTGYPSSSSSSPEETTPPIIPPASGGDALKNRSRWENNHSTRRRQTVTHPVSSAPPYQPPAITDAARLESERRDAYADMLRSRRPKMHEWFAETVKAPLQDDLTEPSYTSFIDPIIPVNITRAAAVLYLEGPGSASWVSEHYLDRITALIRAVKGFEACTVTITSAMDAEAEKPPQQ